jgi:nucleotide-binding universal stress UspA family protein
MPTKNIPFHKILVATDFSPHAHVALQQAVWVASRAQGEVMLAHVVTDLATAAAEAACDLRHEIAAGDLDRVRSALRDLCRDRLETQLAPYHGAGVTLRHETMLGRPFVELIRAVHHEGYDLILAGTRGLRGWKRFLLGGTAKRLVRKCPSSVWVVHAEHGWPLKKILVAIDFSEVSRKAYRQTVWLAQQAGAELHLLHVIEPSEVHPVRLPQETGAEAAPPSRGRVEQAALARLEQFTQAAAGDPLPVERHVVISPEPWRSISSLAGLLEVDLVALGTVGRGGIPGLLLGNTAEKVLHACDCGILTVKPDGFVSPLLPGL